MFGPRITNFGLGSILGNVSKTLNLVNNIIPIYKEARPMVQNARNAISLIKEFGNTATNRVITKTNEHMKPFKENINSLKINNNVNKKGPTFFQ